MGSSLLLSNIQVQVRLHTYESHKYEGGGTLSDSLMEGQTLNANDELGQLCVL